MKGVSRGARLRNTDTITAETRSGYHTTLHGVFVVVEDVGVLLTGASGIGKSELALELIHRGHCLVADDAVECVRMQSMLVGSCPPVCKHFLHIRNLGAFHVPSVLGDTAVADEHSIDMMIDLQTCEHMQALAEPLTPSKTMHTLLDVSIPCFHIASRQTRNMPSLVELAVRLYVCGDGVHLPCAPIQQPKK